MSIRQPYQTGDCDTLFITTGENLVSFFERRALSKQLTFQTRYHLRDHKWLEASSDELSVSQQILEMVSLSDIHLSSVIPVLTSR